MGTAETSHSPGGEPPPHFLNVHGVLLYEPGDMVCLDHRREGKFEPAVMREWLAQLDPEKVAIDVGSYSGLYAIAAAQRGIQAVAWEPNPDLVRRIKKNAEVNEVKIEVMHYGAGSRARQKFLVARFPTSSAGHLVDSVKPGRQWPRVDVYRLDDFPIDPVSVIKIDVEGAEAEVLIGAHDIIKRDRPVVIAEALNDQAASAVQNYFVNMGYRHEWLDDRNLVFRPCGS